MSDSPLYLAARAIMATISATMVSRGLPAPIVHVARQGTAAEDGCECDGGRLVTIWQTGQPPDGTAAAQPTTGVFRLGAGDVGRWEDSFRVRWSGCWPAVVTGPPLVYPTPDEIDAAGRLHLRYLDAFRVGLVGGAWQADLPESLRWDDWRIGRIEPTAPAGGCAGWQALVFVGHDLDPC